ncbi:unnamed protein product [Arabis nemorensis]|uniref:Uncharacterized protein n=1 Tax=Arabis nemorensis TaxID=586526 RepID=A0A565BAE6_9BRAS|nr:unnamed protein product [Arabis nemorensis]
MSRSDEVIKLEDSSDVDNSIQSEGVSGQCSSLADEIQRSTEEEELTKTTERKGKLETCETKTEGEWRCFNQEKNGVREDEEFPIVLREYDVDDIIKEESTYEGSASNTSSLIASLTKIFEKHEKETLFQTRRKLRMILKQYRNIKVKELVTRSDFEQILTMAARFEELTSASVSYIARLSLYTSVIKKGPMALQRFQLAQQRATLLREMANEKQKRVSAELGLAKALAHKGDTLHVKLFAMEKAIVKFEAKKDEVEMSFQKIVANLSLLIEEAAQAFEEHHVAALKWKEEVKPSLEYSYDDIESAESDWASFLNTL